MPQLEESRRHPNYPFDPLATQKSLRAHSPLKSATEAMDGDVAIGANDLRIADLFLLRAARCARVKLYSW